MCHIQNLKTIYDNKEFSFSRKLILVPDTIKNQELSLTLISNERMKGSFKYGKRKYLIRVKKPLSGSFDTSIQYINARIDDKMDSLETKYNKDNIIHFNDTVKNRNNVFTFKYISPFLDEIILQPLPLKSFPNWTSNIKRPAVIKEADVKGRPYPELKYLSDSISLLKPGGINKVLFINFWFASCIPCVAEFPALNSLYKQYENDTSFKLISFTFESRETIQKMREQHSLLFDIYPISLIDVMKLNLDNFFPTNILLDKNGFVKELYVGGETDSEHADYFFKTEIIPKISGLLK